MPSNVLLFQLFSKESEPPNKVLDRILHAWARKHEITIEPLQALNKKWPDRYRSHALGVSDFLNGVIGISNNGKIDTLAEEVSHFAIELLYTSDYNDHEGHHFFPLGMPYTIRQSLNRIHLTYEYEEVKKEYAGVYVNEIDFRKEALAKILCKEIVYLFRVKEIIKKKQHKYESFKNFRVIIDDIIYFLNRKLGISTVAKNDIEKSIKKLARKIVNQERIKPGFPYGNECFGIEEVKSHNEFMLVENEWNKGDLQADIFY